MNKTVVVHAHFVTYAVEEPQSLGAKVKNFFLKEAVKSHINSGIKSEQITQRYTSDKTIDIVRLNEDINNEVAELNRSGYEIISITPITSGEYKYNYRDSKYNPNWSWSYGFGYTSGVVILAKKNNHV